MSDTPFEELRIAILAGMVSKAPEKRLGRTQIMKLFYFLQELKGVPLGYDFRLFTYGPFDSEVLSDLGTACNLGTLIEKTVIYSKGYGYDIKPSSQADILIRELEDNHPDVASQVEDVVSEFGAFSAAELELRSTIFFVDREISQEGSKMTEKELAERVRQIKPYFSLESILERVDEMKKKGWLEGLSDSTST
jgi:uncharacterized protein YwgA